MLPAPGSASIQVLVVTPDQGFASMARNRLSTDGELSVQVASAPGEAISVLTGNSHVDCIVSDHDLPEVDAIAFLEVVRAQAPSLPFVLFTTEGSEKVASRAITAGVTEYLIKERHANQWEKLGELVRDAVGYYRAHGDVHSVENRAETLLDNSYDAIWVVQDGICEYVNQTGADLLDVPGKSVVLGTPISEWVKTGSSGTIREALSDFEDGPEPLDHLEGQLLRSDGRQVPAQFAISRLDRTGEDQVVIVARDLRERKERERELNRFVEAVEAAGHAIYMTDTDGEIFYVNPAFERITGFSESEALGSNPRILQSGEMPEGYYDDLWETVTAGDTWEEVVVNRRKNGQLYHAEQTIAPIVDSTAELVGYVAIQTDITERKRTEERLRQYKQSVESSKDLLAAIDGDWEYLFANETYREYHGLEDRNVSGRSLQAVLGRDQFETIQPGVQSAFDGEVVQAEVTRTHPDRGDRILDVRLFPLKDGAGTVKGVGASMRDITEDREREAAIERESEYRRLMSQVNHTLVRGTDIENVVQTVTEIVGSSSLFTCTFTFLLETTGTDVVCEQGSELTADSVRDIHDQTYVDRVFEAGVLEMADVTEPPFEQHERSKPSHRGLGIAIGHGDDRYGVLTVHFPPGEQPSAEEIEVLETIGDDLGYYIDNRLIRSEYKTFTEIVERIDDPVMLQNRDGTYRVTNEAVSTLSGLPKSELLGADESAFMDESAATKVQEMKSRVLETETPSGYKLTATFPDGRERTFSTTRYPYYDDAGRLDGTIAICRDITDLEEHQRQFRVLDRVLRHNVNNNMNVVQGYAEMIEEQASGDLSRYAEKIADNGGQLLDIAQKQRKITEFLSDSEPIEEFDLVVVLDHVVERLETRYPEIDISVSVPARAPVRAIKSIEEAIEELLENSVVHSGTVSPDPEVGIEILDSVVRIRVRDSNRPISSMDRTVLTGTGELDTLRHGSGLGLWLVKLVVDRAGGTVTHAGNEPRGNVVTIELPHP